MNKKQIEEMAIDLEEEFVLCGTLSSCGTKRCSQCFSKYLYEQGYRKLPDGAVILTPEERDEEMKEINKTLAERDELKAENERLKEVIADQNELCWNCKKSVKEFAERLKEKASYLETENRGLGESSVDRELDEILKVYRYDETKSNRSL